MRRSSYLILLRSHRQHLHRSYLFENFYSLESSYGICGSHSLNHKCNCDIAAMKQVWSYFSAPLQLDMFWSKTSWTNLVNAKATIMNRLSNHPATEKALGIVRAPVPTIKLNTYTRPTCNGNEHRQKSTQLGIPFLVQEKVQPTAGEYSDPVSVSCPGILNQPQQCPSK